MAPPATPLPPRKYAIHELLAMRLTLKHVCCPIKKFTIDAWEHRIIKIYAANPVKVSVDSQPVNSPHRQVVQFTPQRQQSHPIRQPNQQNGARSDNQRRLGQFATQHPASTPVQTAQMYPPPGIPTPNSGERRYVSSPLANLAGISPNDTILLGIDPVRQGILRNVARFYPQVNMPPVLSPMNPSVVFSGYPSPSPQAMRGIPAHIAAQPMEVPSPTPVVRQQHAPGPVDLSGSYPAVTIGAAGYSKGPSQGFVPGGTLKATPITGVTPTVEKGEPNWDTTKPSVPAAPESDFDSETWVQSINRSFRVYDINDGNDREQPKVKLPGKRSTNVLAPAGEGNAPQATTPGVDKGKGKEVLAVVEEQLPPPPPPMLGTSSAKEHQLAFIEFMKMRNRTASGSPGPNRKENVATSPPEAVDGGDAGSGFATGVGYEGRPLSSNW